MLVTDEMVLNFPLFDNYYVNRSITAKIALEYTMCPELTRFNKLFRKKENKISFMIFLWFLIAVATIDQSRGSPSESFLAIAETEAWKIKTSDLLGNNF